MPAMNMEPPSVFTPTVAPFEPWTRTLPWMPGFWELLATTLPRPPPRKRRTATAVSSTSTYGWLRFAHAP